MQKEQGAALVTVWKEGTFMSRPCHRWSCHLACLMELLDLKMYAMQVNDCVFCAWKRYRYGWYGKYRTPKCVKPYRNCNNSLRTILLHPIKMSTLGVILNVLVAGDHTDAAWGKARAASCWAQPVPDSSCGPMQGMARPHSHYGGSSGKACSVGTKC